MFCTLLIAHNPKVEKTLAFKHVVITICTLQSEGSARCSRPVPLIAIFVLTPTAWYICKHTHKRLYRLLLQASSQPWGMAEASCQKCGGINWMWKHMALCKTHKNSNMLQKLHNWVIDSSEAVQLLKSSFCTSKQQLSLWRCSREEHIHIRKWQLAYLSL